MEKPVSSTALESHLYQSLLAEEETISFTFLEGDVDEESLHLAMSRLLASRWNLFFVSQTYTLKLEGERVVYMRPQYLFSGPTLSQKREEIDAHLHQILSGISHATSPLEVVFYLHDYLICQFSYDDTHTTYDLYGMLTTKTGVCQAYALLFSALCESAHIPCEVVLCFSKQHEWNLVNLYGNWYHIDLTWDETELPYLGRVPHRFFLLDDQTLRHRREETREDWKDAYVWDAPHTATDPTFAHLPLDDCAGRTASQNGILYFATTKELFALDPRTLTVTSIFTFPKKDEGYPYVTLALFEETIYFNLSSHLYRISQGGTVSSLGSALPDGVYYYGIGVEENTLVCQTKY